MKILHVVFVIVFLFTCIASPARAAAAGREVFIPLVTQSDPNLPVWVRAEKSYRTFLPMLVAAKHQGQIVDFYAEASVGLLTVKYAAGAPSLTFFAQQETSDLGAALAQVPLESNNLATPEGTGTVFTVSLYSSCFSASRVPYQGYVSALLYDASGKLLNVSPARQATSTTSGGCFFPRTQIEPGHKIIYKVYDKTATILLGTYTSTIPTLKVNPVNKAEARISGIGPAGKPYFVSWYHWGVGPDRTTQFFSYDGTIGSDQKWTADLSDTTSMRGGDYLTLEFSQTPRFVFQLYRFVPAIHCTIAEGFCLGFAQPFQTVNITITHAGRLSSLKTNAGPEGRFYIDLFDYSSQHGVVLQQGDKISVSGLGEYILPNLTAKINYETDVVSGIMPKNSYASLFLVVMPFGQEDVYDFFDVASAPSKNFYALDVTSTFDLKVTDTIRVTLIYTDPETGNSVYKVLAFAP